MRADREGHEPKIDGRRVERLAASLTELRRRSSLSQQEMGERIGMVARRVSRIENGHVNPRLHEVVALAEVLGVPLDRLVFGEEPQQGGGQ